MLGIKIRDTFLSLYPKTRLSFEISHQVGIVVDGLDRISGGFSFPVDIPIDDINVSIIGHVNRLDVNTVLMSDEYCEVWVEGVMLYIGKATIKKSAHDRASLFMVFNEVKDLEDVQLAEIDLGGDRNIGADEATRTAHADDTVINPLDHDYVFAPVYNPVYRPLWDDAFPTAQQTHIQNFWDGPEDGAFKEYAACAITPFIRLDYLLQRIFNHNGYHLDNQWQNTDELKLILLYNNFNINTHTLPAVSSWDEVINLVNHVPARSSVDLVKGVIGTYALGIFPDPVTKVVELIPFATLIAAPEAADWTSRTAAGHEYTTDRDYISRWRYGLDENDEMSVRFSVTDFPLPLVYGTGLTARQIFELPLHLNGIHYAIADNTYYDIQGSDATYAGQDFKEVNMPGSLKEYISELIPMWNSKDLETDGDENPSLPIQQMQLPAIEHRGYVKEWADTKTPLTSFRVMLYRGFQPYDVGISGTYPMAGVTAYNMRGELVGEHSLLWDREHGIYEKYWKSVYHMLANKKQTERTLQLTIADLVNFRFKHKIRIENQHYFMTRLRFTISEKGIGPTEATMITIN